MFLNYMKKIHPTAKLNGLLLFCIFLFLPFDSVVFTYALSLLFVLLLCSYKTCFDIFLDFYKTRYIFAFLLLYLLYVKFEFFFVGTNMLKGLGVYFYCCALSKTTSAYELAKGIASIIDFFRIARRKVIEKCYRFFYKIKQVKESIYEFYLVAGLRGIPVQFLSAIERISFRLSNFKLIYTASREKVAAYDKQLKMRGYEIINRKYRYENKFARKDYIYLLLHLCLFVLYIWRVKI